MSPRVGRAAVVDPASFLVCLDRFGQAAVVDPASFLTCVDRVLPNRHPPPFSDPTGDLLFDVVPLPPNICCLAPLVVTSLSPSLLAMVSVLPLGTLISPLVGDEGSATKTERSGLFGGLVSLPAGFLSPSLLTSFPPPVPRASGDFLLLGLSDFFPTDSPPIWFGSFPPSAL